MQLPALIDESTLSCPHGETGGGAAMTDIFNKVALHVSGYMIIIACPGIILKSVSPV